MIDVAFAADLPGINDALEVRRQDGTLLVLEVHAMLVFGLAAVSSEFLDTRAGTIIFQCESMVSF